ncbi:nidogen-like domain-containing protein [Nocardioides sp. Soil805]|uniref:nidogen-like domain-containing protein n=1 Tax=Nocardioides sp. Soil805 TaxID=1736416 RepID=UPI0007034B3F|nr:nidogen-like domain-containing protein [Nocardioides sp. Soil805]KRF37281.1 hypothetical protein ASG94_08070 [Nocardioides sp. Soil805]
MSSTRPVGRILVLLLVALGLSVVSTAPATSADRDGPGAKREAALLSATITGTVVKPSGGQSIDGEVDLYRWDPVAGFFDFADFVDVTDAAPTYSFSAEPGDYYLAYSDLGGNYGYTISEGALNPPDVPGDPGAFAVADGASATVDLNPVADPGANPLLATGSVLSSTGGPLANASVTAWVWDAGSTSWLQDETATTGTDGLYTVGVPANSTLTFRFTAGRHASQFYGGGDALPDSPTASNSVTTTTTDVALGAVTLTRLPSALGTVAGQVLPYCTDNSLTPNDDGTSAAIPAPFPVRFFGNPQSTMFVNNNGNLTFGSGLSQFTPSSLTGATDQPIIAPFFADFDTSGPDSGVTTYGTSPDGKTFCAQWADLGYFSEHTDKLNTVQMLLRSTEDQPGRSAGDFDITFNYDRIQWETGDASDGVGGLGGTSAAAGFSAGSGVAGTFVQLAGSFVNGALLDGGPNALISGSQGSSQAGRYVFEVRNEGLTTSYGSMSGTVVDAAGDPVVDAFVQTCLSDGSSCSYTSTNASGAWSFAAVSAGQQAITVWPPSDDLFAGGAAATVVAGQATVVPPIVLTAPIPMPANVTLGGQAGGSVPSVYYGEPLDLVVPGCAGVVSPTYTVTINGIVVRNRVPMTESPSGVYSATIPAFYPDHGDALISTNIPATCGAAPVAFNIYIDPSGTVTDQWGRPIAGATVTLLRSETSDGPYVAVPDGSDIMSPSNRNNPDTTDGRGFFRWDVSPGWYQVEVDAAGCGSVTTAGMQVPPERIDLVIRTTCAGLTAPTASAAPTVTGNPQVGGTLQANAARWPNPLEAAGLELLRNGVPLPGTSHTVTAGDVGAVFTARSTGRRPDYVDASQELTVTFLPVTVTSAGVTGTAAPAPPATTPPPAPAPAPAPAPTPAPAPAPAVKKTSTTSVKLSATRIRAGGSVKVTVKVKVAAGGSKAGRVKIYDGKKLVKKVKVGSSGKITVKLKKVKAGKHKIKAVFAGNATTSPSTSKVVKLKAT